MNYVIAFCMDVSAGFIMGNIFDNKASPINNSFNQSWTTGLSIFLRQVAHVLLVMAIYALLIGAAVLVYLRATEEVKWFELYIVYGMVLLCIGVPTGMYLGKFNNIPNVRRNASIKAWFKN